MDFFREPVAGLPFRYVDEIGGPISKENLGKLGVAIDQVRRVMTIAIRDIRDMNPLFFAAFPNGNAVVIAGFMTRLAEIKKLDPCSVSSFGFDGVMFGVEGKLAQLEQVMQVRRDLFAFVESKQALHASDPDSQVAKRLVDIVLPVAYAFNRYFLPS